jgi:hypothetical protein
MGGAAVMLVVDVVDVVVAVVAVPAVTVDLRKQKLFKKGGEAKHILKAYMIEVVRRPSGLRVTSSTIVCPRLSELYQKSVGAESKNGDRRIGYCGDLRNYARYKKQKTGESSHSWANDDWSHTK